MGFVPRVQDISGSDLMKHMEDRYDKRMDSWIIGCEFKSKTGREPYVISGWNRDLKNIITEVNGRQLYFEIENGTVLLNDYALARLEEHINQTVVEELGGVSDTALRAESKTEADDAAAVAATIMGMHTSNPISSKDLCEVVQIAKKRGWHSLSHHLCREWISRNDRKISADVFIEYIYTLRHTGRVQEALQFLDELRTANSDFSANEERVLSTQHAALLLDMYQITADRSFLDLASAMVDQAETKGVDPKTSNVRLRLNALRATSHGQANRPEHLVAILEQHDPRNPLP